MNAQITLVMAADQKAVQTEQEFRTLGSLGFVRGVTALDQWFLLVNEAWSKTQLPLNEMVRDYLVVMLHRHMANVNLLEQLSAFSYAEYLFGKRHIDEPCINEVADLCLQYAAFFPTRSNARHEMKSYHYVIETGISLYRQLAGQAEGKDDWYSRAFQAVARSFGQAIMILRSACPRVVNKQSSSVSWKNEAVKIATDEQAQKTSGVIHGMEQLLLDEMPMPTQTRQ